MAAIGSASTTVLHVGADESVVERAIPYLDGSDDETTVTTVSEIGDTLTAVAETDADCVVSEFDLRDGTAVALLEALRAEYPAIPVVVLADDADDAAESVEAGATDALTTALATASAELLAERIRGALLFDDAADGTAMSGRQYRTLIEHSADIVTVMAPDGTIEYQSPSVERVLGWEPGELVGEYAFNYVHPDDREELRERFIELTDRDGTVVDEVRFRFKRADGSWAWFEGVGSNRKDTTVGGYVFNSREITERKARERELQRAETTFQNAQDGIALVDVTDDCRFEIERINPAYEEMSGLSLPEIRGRTPREILDDEIGRRIEGRFQECVDRQTQLSYEEAYDIPGIPTHWHTQIAPVVVDGEVDQLVVSTRDITERKERERELKLRDRAISEAPIGITIADRTRPNTPVVYANDGFRELTGYDGTAIEGRPLTHLVSEETDRAKRAELEAAIDGEDDATVELLLARRDETPFWGRVSVAPVKDEDGDVTHTVGFLQDITEPKEYEQWIERRFDEFSEVLAEDLRDPLREAQAQLSTARDAGDEQALDAAEDWLDRAEDLLDDLTTVHSFSVKSRDVSEAARRGSRGSE
ncbi:hypothetical protein BV210_03535 [Halorientalis sp. IM1011]|uniref:PAS domain S-box protein n=1 Tax=Halorientalis sp. IM1011 TaxID=1932360 RepID=UPI00097CC99E|nr:PAS domain S-box protein [Halorientalis sp. IM1011]AQL41843.1 hypothetical protein BV210_03535 [Halorientalis sp. IM1011]